jgi:putative SOS response-associated peptidase YedK
LFVDLEFVAPFPGITSAPIALYRLTLDQPPRNTQARYNIYPTTTVDTVVTADRKRSLVPMRWGIVPAWWSKPLKELRLGTFNARAETIATKPFFRGAFRSRRCLMPASGYYEWHDAPGGKQPYYFTRRDGQPITFAAVHETWTNVETKEPLRSCSMVITEPKYPSERRAAFQFHGSSSAIRLAG